jgi:hypothetical protein
VPKVHFDGEDGAIRALGDEVHLSERRPTVRWVDTLAIEMDGEVGVPDRRLHERLYQSSDDVRR